ncbi:MULTISPECIES: UbiA family prenyltransferase [unclassified Streptomyces]|uniref:UbiA family prenyltransferase n=1 Tax=unclassified Streptomyces TaxID=2593676 RepID=UPI002E2E63F7|nr:UbiA family prenyltransferase [Streptomyces sp. NBC_00223]
MSQTVARVPGTPGAPGSPAPTDGPGRPKQPRWRAYAKLGKLSFFDYYLSALVVWTMLPGSYRWSAGTIGTLLVVTVGWIGVCAATVAFDDITGFRDGSDHVNYDPAQQLRRRDLKPLLDGTLTLRQALGFGYGALGVGLLALAVTVLTIAPHRPPWDLGLMALLVFISVQYSYGLRLSYHGCQELVLFTSTALVVFVPVPLITGHATGPAIVQAVLFGLWSVLVSLYSNIKDIEGDRAAGRRTWAVMLPWRIYRKVIAAVSAAETVVLVVGAVTGAVPWWFPLFLLPVVALRLRQLIEGLLLDDPLTARRWGGKAHRLGVVALLAANLVAFH